MKLIAILLFIPVFTLYAQKLTASDAEAEDFFGSSISISGNFAFVGTPYNDSNGADAGAVYVYQNINGNWNEIEKLVGSEVDAVDFFGQSVSVDKDVALIGSPGDAAGLAYVFRWNGSKWMQESVLKPSDGMMFDGFGSAVTIKNNTAIVSSPNDQLGTGVVYVYEKEGNRWIEKNIVYDNSAVPGDYFGFALDLNDNETEVIIGSRGQSSGYAGIFQKSGSKWAKVAKLTPKYPGMTDYYGSGVKIHDDIAVVSARFEDNIGMNSGAAYVFRKTGTAWKYETKLIPNDACEEARFGEPAIGENTIIIGCSHDDENGLDAGAVYVYLWDGTEWLEIKKEFAPDGFAGDGYGIEMDADGNTILIGAPYNSEKANNSGAAYIQKVDLVPDNLHIIFRESFDGQSFPPAGWSTKVKNEGKTWRKGNISDEPSFNMFDVLSKYSAICPWSDDSQDEWIITPEFALPEGKAFLRFYTCYKAGSLSDAMLRLNISTDGGINWDVLWEAKDDECSLWAFREAIIELNEYGGKSGLHLAWQYEGSGGGAITIDGIVLWFEKGTTEISTEPFIITDGFELRQNYPNPFNPVTIIKYILPSGIEHPAYLYIYDILGNEIEAYKLDDKSGENQISINLNGLASGVYLYQLRAGNLILMRKMVLMR